MPTFVFRATSLDGDAESGEIRAGSRDEAIASLSERGLLPISVAEGSVKPPWWLREISLSEAGKVARPAEVERFLSALALMTTAGFPIRETLRYCEEQSDARSMRDEVKRLRRAIDDGENLAEALSSDVSKIPRDVREMLAVGDRANQLSETATLLADTLRHRIAVRRQITSALIYPSILIAMSMAVIALLIFFLAPTLAPTFYATATDLPLVLSAMLHLRELFLNRLFEVCVWLTVFVAAFLLVRKATSEQRRRLSYRVPVFGRMLRRRATIELAQSLSIVLRSGATLQEAIRVLSAIVRNRTAREVLEIALNSLDDGNDLVSAFAQPDLLDSSFVAMLPAADSANRLPDLLELVATSLSKDERTASDRAIRLLTPALTLVIGLAIGSLVIATIGSIMTLNDVSL